MVPDESRCIFDSADKLAALLLLSVEMDDLMKEVGQEQNVFLRFGTSTLDQSREAVSQLYIPS